MFLNVKNFSKSNIESEQITMTTAYNKILTLMRALKHELDWEDCISLSARFEQCGIDKQKQGLQAVEHNTTTHRPPITMTRYGT